MFTQAGGNDFWNRKEDNNRRLASDLSDWIVLFRQEPPSESEDGIQIAGQNPPDLGTWSTLDNYGYSGSTVRSAQYADGQSSVSVTERFSDDTNTVYNPNNPVFAGEVYYTATKPGDGTATDLDGDTYNVPPFLSTAIDYPDYDVPAKKAPLWAYNRIPKAFFVDRDNIQGDVITYIPPLVQSEIEKPIRALSVMVDKSGQRNDAIVRQSMQNNATHVEHVANAKNATTARVLPRMQR